MIFIRLHEIYKRTCVDNFYSVRTTTKMLLWNDNKWYNNSFVREMKIE